MKVPTDPLTCLRLARSIALAAFDAPDFPLILGEGSDLTTTAALIERLLERAQADPDLRGRAGELAARWHREAARLGLKGGRRRSRRRGG